MFIETLDINAKPSSVAFLKASVGQSRLQLLTTAVQQYPSASCHVVTSNASYGGVWAGVRELLWTTVTQARQETPQLFEKHSHELCLVFPELRRTVQTLNPTLTEMSEGDEKVRSYPADRAYRAIHGVIDFMTAWSKIADINAWVIACDQFDSSSSLVQVFFSELIRRRGNLLNISLVLGVDSVDSSLLGLFSEPDEITASSIESTVQTLSPEEARRIALGLEEQAELDSIEQELLLPKLVSYWRLAGDIERIFNWESDAFDTFNHYGYYRDGLAYGESAFQKLESVEECSQSAYGRVLSGLVISYMALGEIEKAHNLLQKGLSRVAESALKVHLYYLTSMLYVRFLPPEQQDVALAEEYIVKAQRLLEQVDSLEDERHFMHSFLLNGLAFIRVRQRRIADTLAICEACIAHLDEYLSPERHRLHRSVLYYNTAQVHFFTNNFDSSIDFYTAAMQMDPNYSEYYNERGNTYLQMGRLDDAIQDYQKAIELSPPYAEVFLNLGQCFKQKGEMEQAIAAYSRALDLDPNLLLAYIGRAQAADQSGELQEALDDYSAALRFVPNDTSLLANQAAVLYELGSVEASIEALDLAIEIEPEWAELYHNRSLALQDLGRSERAQADWEQYVLLAPEALHEPVVGD